MAPWKYDLTDEEVLEQLREADDRVKGSLTITDLDTMDEFFSAGFVKSRFGTWNDAKRRAGLTALSGSQTGYTDEELLDILREANKETDHSITKHEFNDLVDDVSAALYHTRFGSWNEAKQQVGIRINIGGKDTGEPKAVRTIKEGGPTKDISPHFKTRIRHNIRRIKITTGKHPSEYINGKTDVYYYIPEYCTPVEVASAWLYGNDILHEGFDPAEKSNVSSALTSRFSGAIQEAVQAVIDFHFEEYINGENTSRNLYSDRELRDTLQEVDERVDGNLTTNSYIQNSTDDDPSLTTILSRFGDWESALEETAITKDVPSTISNYTHYSDDDVLDALARVDDEITGTLTSVTYMQNRHNAEPTSATVSNHFGSWTEAKDELEEYSKSERNDSESVRAST